MVGSRVCVRRLKRTENTIYKFKILFKNKFGIFLFAAPLGYKTASISYFKFKIFREIMSVKVKKKLNSRNFCFKKQCTLWKLRKFTHTLFGQKFRENNNFNYKITLYIIDLTKYFFGESKFFAGNFVKLTVLLNKLLNS